MKYEKFAAFDSWLADKAAAGMQRCAALRADQRGDEAAFEIVSANVYDIFRSVMAAAEKVSADETAASVFFAKKLEDIPAVWRSSRALDLHNGDEIKAHIESIKLAAAEEIKREWESRI